MPEIFHTIAHLNAPLNSMQSFGDINKEIRKQSRSVKNRIHSILNDSKFVLQVCQAYGLPLIANERCGRWYIPTKDLVDSVYFKSTDGHTSQWGFSTRRLNLHILDVIVNWNGIIVVDSTRRGKRMPDALSKTIPIWCAVLNQAIFNHQFTVHVPPNAVSKSEQHQIQLLLNDWVQQFLATGINLDSLRSKLIKPLRPLWITPDAYLPMEIPDFQDFYPVICCTASAMIQDGVQQSHGYSYVQGAADDHELWAQGLTPQILWAHLDDLANIDLTDLDIHEHVQGYVKEPQDSSDSIGKDVPFRLENTNIWLQKVIDPLDIDKINTFDLIINISSTQIPLESPSSKYLQHNLGTGKKAGKALREVLPAVCSAFDQMEPDQNTLILCDTGTDLAVGIALSLLCLYFAIEGKRLPARTKAFLDKACIRQRLVQIIAQYKCNPSRATLTSVNSFLMT